MPSPTVISTKASAQDSRIWLSSSASAILKVASVTITTVVVDDITPLTNTGLYAAGTPGQLVIVEGVAAADNGKTANVTLVNTGTKTLTVSVDLTTALADGDLIFVAPPLSIELFTNGGHTLATTIEDDETMGLTETFLTHGTRSGARVGGEIPIYGTVDSEGLGRVLLAGTGGYKKVGAAGTHHYIPFKADDGTFAENNDFTVLTQDGDEVVRQIWGAMFGTQTVINFPERGIANASLSSLGAAVVREVGGTGRLFTEGASNYILATLDADTGPRHTYQGVRIEDGGVFGDAITDAADRFVRELSITITRGALEDPTLGNQFIIKPVEDTHGIVVTGSRFLEDDTFAFEDAWGGANAAEPGAVQFKRFVIEAVSPSDATKTLTVDIPRAKVRSRVTRQRGRFLEEFTITGVQTLTAAGQVDTAKPLYRIIYVNGEDVNYSTAL